MRTWNIAKLLIEHCDSPEDVDQVIVILRDSSATQQVCSILSAFSNSKLTLSHTDADGSTITRKEWTATVPKVRKSVKKKGIEGVYDTSKVSTVNELESLFRSAGMTNKQVEQWFANYFSVRVTIGKDSLRKYLTKVLNKADLGLCNRILAAAQRLVNKESAGASEIKTYWDEFDKRYSVVE